jgi:hypothetical protein
LSAFKTASLVKGFHIRRNQPTPTSQCQKTASTTTSLCRTYPLFLHQFFIVRLALCRRGATPLTVFPRRKNPAALWEEINSSSPASANQGSTGANATSAHCAYQPDCESSSASSVLLRLTTRDAIPGSAQLHTTGCVGSLRGLERSYLFPL